MNKRFLAVTLVATLLASGALICAAAETQKGTVFSVTPRVWLAYVNQGDEEWSDSAAFTIPMSGLSISVSPRQIPNWSFLVNGYYGTAEGKMMATVPNMAHYSGKADYERYDVELLVRYTFPGTGLSLFSGPRYVKWRRKQTVPGVFNNFNRLDTDTWAPEIGVGYVSDIGDSGKHRFFGNFTVGIARTSWQVTQQIPPAPLLLFANVTGNGIQPSIDGNMGYEFFLAKFCSASVRYRHFILFDESGGYMKRFTSYHGPEFALSFRF